MEKVVIIGSSGFIGSNLLASLRGQNIECICPKKGDEESFFENYQNSENSENLHIVYAAGLTSDFREKIFDTIEAHICLLKNILQKSNFTSLTYISSTRVYEGAKCTLEESPLQVNPNVFENLYNISKLCGESLALCSGKKNIKIIRLSNVIGQRVDEDFFIDKLLREGLEKGEIKFLSSLDCEKDYIYIEDAISIMQKIILSSQIGGIFNVASGKNTTNQEIANAIKEKTNFKIKTQNNGIKNVFLPINISKIQKDFNFKPREFSDYFPDFLEKYLKNKN